MDVTRRDAAVTIGAALAAGLMLGSKDAEADCPNIVKAIAALQLAQGDLQRAAHDFGGHRADALKAVNNALDQMGLCLQAPQCK